MYILYFALKRGPEGCLAKAAFCWQPRGTFKRENEDVIENTKEIQLKYTIASVF